MQGKANVEKAGVEAGLAHLNSPFVAMVYVATDKYADSALEAVTALTAGKRGVYITINRPCAKLDEVFRENNIDTSKIIFIDAITQIAMPNVKSGNSYVYIKHPSDLTNMYIRLLEALKKIDGKKFLVVDSISTLMVYNSPETVLRFAHALASKLPAQGVDVVYIALLDEKNASVESIAGMCDKVLRA